MNMLEYLNLIEMIYNKWLMMNMLEYLNLIEMIYMK